MCFLENALGLGDAGNILFAGFQFVAGLAKHRAIIGRVVAANAGRHDVIEMIIACMQGVSATVAVQTAAGERD